MALQTSGTIDLSDVNVELGNSATANIALASAAVRDLFGVASGAITMANGYGASSSPWEDGVSSGLSMWEIALDTGDVNKFAAIANSGSSSGLLAVAGTISSAGVVTFGTPTYVTPTTTGYASMTTICGTSSGKYAVAYRDGETDTGRCTEFTVSGNSITAGTQTVWLSQEAYYPSIAYSAGYVVIVFRDLYSWSKATAICASVSSGSFSFGSKVAYTPSECNDMSVVADPASSTRFIETHTLGDRSQGRATVLTRSGTSISGSTLYDYTASTENNHGNIDIDPNTSGSIVIVYPDNNNNYYSMAIAGSISGTTFTFGTPVVAFSYNTYFPRVAADPDTAGRFAVSGSSGTNTSVRIASVSGTTLTLGDDTPFSTGSQGWYPVGFRGGSGQLIVTTGATAYVGNLS